MFTRSCSEMDTWDDVAATLIAAELPLTALELYTELQARHGTCVPALLAFATTRASQCAGVEPAPPQPPGTACNTAAMVARYLEEQGMAEAAAELRAKHQVDVAAAPSAAVSVPTRLEDVLAAQQPAPAPKTPDTAVAADSLHDTTPAALVERAAKLEARNMLLLRTFSDRLPTLMDSVHVDRKECLLPMALTVLEHHPQAAVRRSLFFHLIHLYKRPSAQQRASLIGTLRTLGEHLAPTARRFADEVLTELLALVQHRYAEKRCLVVSAAHHLSDLIDEESRFQLLTTALVPLAHDPNSVVRAAAAEGVLSTWAPQDRADTVQIVLDVVFDLLVDSKPAVAATANATLPMLLDRAVQRGLLFSHALPAALGALTGCVKGEKPDSASVAQLLRTVRAAVQAAAVAVGRCGDDTEGLQVSYVRDGLPSLWTAMCDPGLTDAQRDDVARSASVVTEALGPAFSHSVMDGAFAQGFESDDAALRQRLLRACVIHHCSTSDAEGMLCALIRAVAECVAPWSAADFPVLSDAFVVCMEAHNAASYTAIAVFLRCMTADGMSMAVQRAAVRVVTATAGRVSENTVFSGVWPCLVAGFQSKYDEVRIDALSSTFVAVRHCKTVEYMDTMLTKVFNVVDADGPHSAFSMRTLGCIAEEARVLPSYAREKHVIPHVVRMCQHVAGSRAAAGDENFQQRKSAALRSLLMVFQALSACPAIGFADVKDRLLPALKLMSRDVDGEEAPVRQLHGALLKEYAAHEARNRPRQSMTFLDKVRHEISSIVK